MNPVTRSSSTSSRRKRQAIKAGRIICASCDAPFKIIDVRCPKCGLRPAPDDHRLDDYGRLKLDYGLKREKRLEPTRKALQIALEAEGRALDAAERALGLVEPNAPNTMRSARARPPKRRRAGK